MAKRTWGSPASVADYVRLAHRLGYPRIYILAESMGGLDAVQLIDRLHPEAWAGIYPVCDAEGPLT
jgi:predicted peptidase